MYPIDRRKIAVHIYALLRSLRKVARLVDVSHSTVARWLKHPDKKQYKQRGSTKSSDTVVQILRASIAAHPFTALADLRQLIKDTLQLSVSKELVRTIIKKLGFSKKKAKRFGTSPDLESKTAAFIARRDALLAEGRRFYSIDETSFGRNGPATYGYALRGQPLLLRKKPEKSVTQTAICCVTDDAITGVDVFPGSANTSKILSFVASLNLPKGSVLLLDNVSFHHALTFKKMCEELKIELLHVPPYSPWFNPIELVFSIVKRAYYRTNQISSSWGRVNGTHIRNFFEKSLRCTGPF
jgi:transposase